VLTTTQGVFVYNAVRTQVVSPNDTTVIKNAPGDFLTLTTCNPRFSASSRLVVTALLAHSQLFPNSGLPKTDTHQKLQSDALAGDSSGQLTDAMFWGFMWLVAGAAVLLAAYRFRRQRWPIYGVGMVGLLALLYVFFTAVTPLLPASF
jgi:sortase A